MCVLSGCGPFVFAVEEVPSGVEGYDDDVEVSRKRNGGFRTWRVVGLFV